MFPIAVASRLGPWLGRAGLPALERAKTALASKGFVGSTVNDVVKWVSENQASALIALSSAGFAISDLFSPEDKKDPEARKLATELAVIEQRAIDLRLSENASKSENLGGLVKNNQDLRMLRDVTQWAVNHYGSANAARRAFKMHQAFLELSESDLDSALELLV